jgi:hypothetical protein
MWLDKALHRLAVMLAVESIHIAHGNFEKLGLTTLAAFFSCFTKLTYLRLGNCTFSSLQQFLSMLSATTHLERLALVSVKAAPESPSREGTFLNVFDRLKDILGTKREADANLNIPQQPVAHLRILEISECDFMEEFVMWLQSDNRVQPVETLLLNIEDTNNMSAFSELMHTLGASLRNLNIQFGTRFGVFQSTAAGMSFPQIMYSF